MVANEINPEKIITKKATEFEMSLNACVSTSLICSVTATYFLFKTVFKISISSTKLMDELIKTIALKRLHFYQIENQAATKLR